MFSQDQDGNTHAPAYRHQDTPSATGPVSLTHSAIDDYAHSRISARSGRSSNPRQQDGALRSILAWARSGLTQGQRRRSSRKRCKNGPPPAPQESAKLGTYGGVFVPTTLNVLSILMFLRFGFILGQSGIVGMMGMLIACFAINLLTTFSLSAVASNGTVRSGGTYYLISRSLGPEFGGSIGILFYLGLVFNTGMNAVGLVDCFTSNFGSNSGNWSHWMPDENFDKYLWATAVLVLCTLICLAGSSLFARASNGLLIVVIVAILSIPISALFQTPFQDNSTGIEYTGLNLETLRSNLLPHFTKHAAGKTLKGRENFQDLFGILFPATGGIFAGASMSGDLRHPSKSIPRGTLYGLGATFVCYTLVILSLGSTITRASFYRSTSVIQQISISEVVVLLGEFSVSFFSSLMGVTGSAKLLQAISRDQLIPGLSIFAGNAKNADGKPIRAIIASYVLTQITMLFDINQIASLVTMAYLMTFLVTNLACFLLRLTSAPNFRPSFHYFSWWSAGLGAVASGFTMFFVDGLYASACVASLIILFSIIHYTSPPKPWGDVSQGLIYHQIRKYLLRLRSEHVKFWRPQILLFVNDPSRQFKLIQFCNSIKKGGLYILGHVIVTRDFQSAVPEAKQQQASWNRYIDFSKIKAFVNINVSPAIEWGARNIVLSAGLGGMRPNIVVMGFYNLIELRKLKPLVDVSDSPQPSNASQRAHESANPSSGRPKLMDRISGILPIDAMRKEHLISAKSYVTVLEDLISTIQVNVAVANGFDRLELPEPTPSRTERAFSKLGLATQTDDNDRKKKYIDLWPIQMSAEFGDGTDNSVVGQSTNFDTYTLILQLGCILDTVPSWKRIYDLRVTVFVEYETDVEEERSRVIALLRNLRIDAGVRVFCLASGELSSYNLIVNGNSEAVGTEYRDLDPLCLVREALRGEEWWKNLQSLRLQCDQQNASQELNGLSESLRGSSINQPKTPSESSLPKPFEGLRSLLRKSRYRFSIGQANQLEASYNMKASNLDTRLVEASRNSSAIDPDASEDSDTEANKADESASEYAVSETSVLVSHRRNSSTRNRYGSVGSFVAPLLERFSSRRRSSRYRSLPHAGPVAPRRSSTAILSSSSDALTPAEEQLNQTTVSPDNSKHQPLKKPPSLPKFTSKLMPVTKVASEEGPGPSITFSENSSPEQSRLGGSSMDQHRKSLEASLHISKADDSREPHETERASGFPAQQSIPLSFNDLPGRAQHLILNEVIKKHSDDTAVVFTTLPSPEPGTGENEEDSERYLTDLEILCQGLPPVLLVHSNHMTVTTNL